MSYRVHRQTDRQTHRQIHRRRWVLYYIKAKEVMEIANRAKFYQNQQLKNGLLDTGNKIITECNPYDKFWSNGLRITLKEADDFSI